MARVFLILVAVAVVIYIGERYFIAHPGGDTFWGSFGSTTETTPAPAPGTSPSATPDHTVATCRAALWAQTQKLLVPLDQNKDFSPAQTVGALRETQRELVQYRADPGYKSLVQACGVLAQVAQERQSYLERYQRDSAPPTPGTASALQMGNLQPTNDLSPQGTGTNSFFKDRVVTEWRERCAYYEPIIDGLLMAR